MVSFHPQRARVGGSASRRLLWAFLLPATLTAAFAGQPAGSEWKAVRFEPRGISLAGPGLSQHYLVLGVDQLGNEADVTHLCRITSSDPRIVTVDTDNSVVTGKSSGRAEIRLTLGDVHDSVEVAVGEGRSEMAVNFSSDVVSILTTKGCNGSGCHGSPAGQNGFKLSLFGYDIGADHQMIIHGHDGRRVDLEHPEQSLLLRKPTFQVAHGGGRLFDVDSEEYETISSWLQSGAPLDGSGVRLEKLELYPAERILAGVGAGQRLVAMGRLSDGTTRDMTREVRYLSADEAVATVSPEGTIASSGRGLTTITARAMGKVATSQIGVIDELAGDNFPSLEANNFIDDLVFAKLRKMNVRPAPRSSDEEFLRRVYLDAIGWLPTPREVSEFVNDTQPDKRARLIDRLLERPQHASHWTVRFEDWLRNCQLHMQGRSMGVFKDWIREWLRTDRPYDEFVRSLLTSLGDTMRNPAANFWNPSADFMSKQFSVNKATPTVSRLFLGIRLECAECHNHPLENFTQDDFYGLAAFLARLRVKHGTGAYRRTWYLAESGEVEHPQTKRPVAPKLPADATPEIPEEVDRRQILAEWVVSPSNPYFARATVNRFWYQYFGAGIVEPYDDLRSTNLPTNRALLDRLAQFFVESGFRLKALHRLILNSRTYQASSTVAGRDRKPSPLERVLFARYPPQRLPAETLLDAVGQVTGVPHRFKGYPEGTSAKDIYIPDIPDYFLVTFGLPRRDILKGRAETPTLSQSLHLMNGDSLREKVEASGNVLGELLEQGASDSEIVGEIYLRAYSRRPKPTELETITEFLSAEQAGGRDHRRGLENFLWAVLNSKEFQLNH